jgi:hypothetical protein
MKLDTQAEYEWNKLKEPKIFPVSNHHIVKAKGVEACILNLGPL